MEHIVMTVAAYVPREILIPLVVGGLLGTIGLICMPATYHWDGKVSSKLGR